MSARDYLPYAWEWFGQEMAVDKATLAIVAMISTLRSSLVVLLGMAKALEMFKGKGSISMFTTRASSGKEFEWFLLAITHLAVVSVAGLGWRLVASHEAGTSG